MSTSQENKTILFYDGVCVLCNFWVQFLFERDYKKVLHYAPLQGPTAEQLLPAELKINLDSIVLYHDQQFLTKSEAILKAMSLIHYSPDVLLILRLTPAFLRNRIYDFVALHRYKLFGKHEVCPIPSPELRKQLLS